MCYADDGIFKKCRNCVTLTTVFFKNVGIVSHWRLYFAHFRGKLELHFCQTFRFFSFKKEVSSIRDNFYFLSLSTDDDETFFVVFCCVRQFPNLPIGGFLLKKWLISLLMVAAAVKLTLERWLKHLDQRGPLHIHRHRTNSFHK